MNPVFRLATELDSQFKPVADYVTEFLTDNHPSRKGSVCPFVPHALATGSFRFSVIEGSTRTILNRKVRDIIEQYSTSENVDALVLLFQIPLSHRMLDRLHFDNQLEAMAKGYMLGMLGPKVHVPSIHHPNFYPFRAPQNILALRDMIPHDIQFFGQGHSFQKARRIKMYEYFLARYGSGNSIVEIEAVNRAHLGLERERKKWF